MPDRRDEVSAALRYTGDGAPRVVAAGRGHVADTILARAREAGVPVHQDPKLATALAELVAGGRRAAGAVVRGGRGAGLGLPTGFPCNYPKGVMEELG